MSGEEKRQEAMELVGRAYQKHMKGDLDEAIDIINAAIALFITARSKLVDRVLRFGGRSS